MAARTHRKGFKPLPKDGWHEDRDGSWEDYKERCVHEGACMDSYSTIDEYIEWGDDNGNLHRLDGPACEKLDGTKAWWVNGQLHRLDGPAIERADGLKAWWVNGHLHRLDGPAFERPDGSVEFHKDGIRYTDITFTQRFYVE